MSFALPLALIVLPVIVALVVLHRRNPSLASGLPGGWRAVIAPEIARYLRAGHPLSATRTLWLCVALAGVLTLALARPLIDLPLRADYANLTGRVIVVDLGTTGDGAGQVLQAGLLAEAASSVPTALVAVAGEAYGIVPLTRDKAQIERYLSVLSPDALPAPGRALHTGIAHAEALLARAGTVIGQIIVITDGPPPARVTSIARSDHLRTFVVLSDADTAWQGIAGQFQADLLGPDSLGDLSARLDRAVQGKARTALAHMATDLTPWLIGLAMVLWLGLFRRRAEQ